MPTPASDSTTFNSSPGKLAAVTCHYNPCGYRRLRENWFRFREAFRGCPLFTIEVSFDGVFHLPAEWQITAGPEHLLWQKEQLLNLAIRQLPAEFDRVAWIDADLLFLNPGWARETTELLDHFSVVQLFETCHYTNATGAIEARQPSLLRKRHAGLKGTGLPGGAWAARRDWLTEHPLYAQNIVGGGDTMFTDALFGQLNGFVTQMCAPALVADFQRWGRNVTESVAGRVGCTQGDVVHCYHGTRERRRYVERAALLRQAQFDPATDLAVSPNGLLQWTGTKPELADSVRAYFEGRREDE